MSGEAAARQARARARPSPPSIPARRSRRSCSRSIALGRRCSRRFIAPYDPFDLASLDVLDAELPPWWLEGSDPRFLLGTDAQGRDLLSAILYGTRISLTVGVLAVAIQAAIGVPLGLLAGYQRRQRSTASSPALADIQLSLSTLMMAIIALALFRAGLGGEP